MTLLASLLAQIGAGHTPWKLACRVVATSPATLSGLYTLSGVALAEGDRVLCTAQAAGRDNGIWLASANAWTRAPDMSTSSYAQLGTTVRVLEGTGAGEYRLASPVTGTITVGVTALTWAFSGGDGVLDAAGPVTVGSTLATSVSVGRAGAPTTISGSTITVTPANLALTLSGAYCQILSSRLVCNTTGVGNVLDLAHPSQEVQIGLEKEVRIGQTSAPYLGLHDHMPVEQQSAWDVASLLSALARQGIVHDSSQGYQVAIRGDSLWTVGATTPTARASRLLGDTLTGASVEDCSEPGDFPRSPAHFYRNVPPRKKSILVLMWGINSFIAGQSAATVQAATTAEVAAALAAGWDEVIVSTVFHAGTTVLSAGQNTQRTTYNSWLLANFGSIGAIACADPAANVNLSNATNLTYFLADQLHLTNAGHTVLAGVMAPVVSARLTGQTREDATMRGAAVTVDGASSVALTSGGSSLTVSASFFSQVITTLWIVASDQWFTRSATSRQHSVRYVPPDVVTTDATVTTAWSLTTTANRVYRVTVRAVCSNDTDNQGGSFEPRYATFRDVTGTVNQIGTTGPASPTDHRDATIPAATVTIDNSGTTLRARVTGTVGKTVRWRLIVDVDEVDLA
jgi:hypothetical protein